jgi:hypothetical protein
MLKYGFNDPDMKTCVNIFKKMKAITSDHLRKFYYSNRHIKEKRTRELQTKKVKDRICAAERRFVQGGDK